MGFLKYFRSLKKSEPAEIGFQLNIDSLGSNFFIDKERLSHLKKGDEESALLRLQYTFLKSMEEAGEASPFANGFEVPHDIVASIDDTFSEVFSLPMSFPGEVVTEITGQTTQAIFDVVFNLKLPTGELIRHFKLEGPFVVLSDTERYRLDAAQYMAFNALQQFQRLSPDERGEFQNNWLMFQLQTAKRNGCDLNLGHFEQIEYVQPDKIGLTLEETELGDLRLLPSFGGEVDRGDVENRLGQLEGVEGQRIFRVKNKFVVLDDARLDAVKEILSSRRIPKEQVKNFLETPTAYLDGALIDLDTGFSLRVKGAEKFEHAYFGDVEKSNAKWFGDENEVQKEPLSAQDIPSLIKDEQSLKEFEVAFQDAVATGADVLDFDGSSVDISSHNEVKQYLEDIKQQGFGSREPGNKDREDLERAVVSIDTNDQLEEFSLAESLADSIEFQRIDFETSNLKRMPFRHQDDGIRWLLGLMQCRFSHEGAVAGGLLADDMGLGKTFMALVALSSYMGETKKNNEKGKPHLIVAPLSLIENWLDEIDQTFHGIPFADIKVLQSGKDLKDFRLTGMGSEIKQNLEELTDGEDGLRYSLKIGKVYGNDRLDQPNRLVLTTYDVMRDYQFSLSRVDWGFVAFDEAQNIKNPNTLASRAAKALKADFKLLATGTPVENSLKDFWCIFDTAVPGLLGSYQGFNEEYIKPILNAGPDTVLEEKLRIGKELRERVGQHMLRRVKEEQLDGLPSKSILTGDPSLSSPVTKYVEGLSGMMKGEQLVIYNEFIDSVKRADPKKKQTMVLRSLHGLRSASIHPYIDDALKNIRSVEDVRRDFSRSEKLKAMLSVLEDIRARDEKVIVFVNLKKLQRYLSFALGLLYGLDVSIINGETKAVSNKKDDATRKSLIKAFEAKSGFNVIIMSPIAAGVGLTVVGANNVIHLERMWNPAKEAQATDRVYRIGQTKDVNVYLPMSLHPEIDSFDIQLGRLLLGKTDLSGAVIATSDVDTGELMRCFS